MGIYRISPLHLFHWLVTYTLCHKGILSSPSQSAKVPNVFTSDTGELLVFTSRQPSCSRHRVREIAGPSLYKQGLTLPPHLTPADFGCSYFYSRQNLTQDSTGRLTAAFLLRTSPSSHHTKQRFRLRVTRKITTKNHRTYTLCHWSPLPQCICHTFDCECTNLYPNCH